MNKRQRKKRRWLYVPKKDRKHWIDDRNLYSRVGDFDAYGPLMSVMVVDGRRVIQRVGLP